MYLLILMVLHAPRCSSTLNFNFTLLQLAECQSCNKGDITLNVNIQCNKLAQVTF